MMYTQRCMWAKQKHSGFTIVELLIVVVVIAILAAITIVSYNGIVNRAITASLDSDLSNARDAVLLYQVDNGDNYPTSLSAVNSGAGVKLSNGNISGYVYDNTTSPKTFAVTVLNGTKTPRSINQNGTLSDGAALGTVGNIGYCPESSFVKPLNGYYCDGVVGNRATQNNPVIKQLASASGVPANAPTYYVGVQQNRDNSIGDSFTVTTGETYCFSGYAATTSSTVTHTVGLTLNGASMDTSWVGTNSLSPSTTWQKINGCITIPAGYTTAQVWTQNNGDYNGAALVAWYHAALMMKKQ